MTRTPSWFEVDKSGLAKLREGTPKSAVVLELVQNVWDTDARTFCKITLKPIPNTRRYRLIVQDDDPEGFTMLSHAYTLFADSANKNDATKRGRFNLGEKLVLALCSQAAISTTTGMVVFHSDGSRTENVRNRTERGSLFSGEIRLTQAEYQEILNTVFSLIPPASCQTTFNGDEIPLLTPLARFEATLPTVIGEELRPSKRKCWVEVYEPQMKAHGVMEKPMIYEMGIPVVETGDRYHYNVLQKVPLTLDRTNVTPAFLRDVREAVAEAMREEISEEDANHTWVREAAANPEATKELVQTVFEKRFGKDAVIYDPSDLEANQRAVLAGRTLVHGGHMSSQEWANVKTHQLARPAGQVFFAHKIEMSPGGREWQQYKNKTRGMEMVAGFAKWFADQLWGISLEVQFVVEMSISNPACFDNTRLTFNIPKMHGGAKAFETGLTRELLDLIIHELAHYKAGNHLADSFHEACTFIGARAVELALKYPRYFYTAGFLTGGPG